MSAELDRLFAAARYVMDLREWRARSIDWSVGNVLRQRRYHGLTQEATDAVEWELRLAAAKAWEERRHVDRSQA